MIKSLRLTRKDIIWLTLLIIFWLTFGRGLFGSSGWIAAVYLFFGTPVLLFVCFIICILAKPDVNESKIGNTESLFIISYFFLLFLHGIFIIDYGDCGATCRGSLLTNALGMQYIDASNIISTVFFYAGIIIALISIGLLAYIRKVLAEIICCFGIILSLPFVFLPVSSYGLWPIVAIPTLGLSLYGVITAWQRPDSWDKGFRVFILTLAFTINMFILIRLLIPQLKLL